MATAAHRDGSDPATTRKKGPKTSGAKAGSGVKRKRVCGSQRAELRVIAGTCNGTTDLDDFEINRLRVYFS
jgi:hypothetical protein